MERRPRFTAAASFRRVPPPVPDPAALAAAAPLRAIILAQLAAAERRWAAVRSGVAPPNPTPSADADCAPQLRAYWHWCEAAMQSYVVEEGGEVLPGHFRHMAILFLTPDDLRDPTKLDAYVSGTPWYGLTGPWIWPPLAPPPDDEG